MVEAYPTGTKVDMDEDGSIFRAGTLDVYGSQRSTPEHGRASRRTKSRDTRELSDALVARRVEIEHLMPGEYDAEFDLVVGRAPAPAI